MKYLARFIMWLAGWRYKGELPQVKKAVIISVPHTSNWDFVWGELAFLSQGIPAYILMKKEFFFFPLGLLLRALRVIPVDRGKKDSHLVQQMIAEFNKRDSMYLCITPEEIVLVPVDQPREFTIGAVLKTNAEAGKKGKNGKKVFW